MEPLWRFPEQIAYTRAEVLRNISDYLWRYCGQSEEIIVPYLCGPLVDYQAECEEQEEEDDDCYYDAFLNAFDGACSCLKSIFRQNIVLTRWWCSFFVIEIKLKFTMAMRLQYARF